MSTFKVLSPATNYSWQDLPLEPAPKENQTEQEKKFREMIAEATKRENLLFLLAAGASRSVKLKEGVVPLMGDIFDEIKKHASYEDITKKLNVDKDSKDFEAFLSKCVFSQKVNEDAVVKKFLDDARDIISKKCNFLTNESDIGVFDGFIRKLCAQGVKKTRSKIFTLNYDLCVESSASKTGVTLIDGFSFSFPYKFNPSYFDYDIIKREEGEERLLENVIHLYKMHGSLNWSTERGHLEKKDGVHSKPLLIFPTKDKFQNSYEHPFIEMVSRFKDNLRKKATTLVVVGYSCGDEHINSIIENALQLNFDLKIIFVDKVISDNPKFLSFTKFSSDLNDSRISFIETTFDHFVKSILPEGRGQSKEEKLLRAFATIQQGIKNE